MALSQDRTGRLTARRSHDAEGPGSRQAYRACIGSYLVFRRALGIDQDADLGELSEEPGWSAKSCHANSPARSLRSYPSPESLPSDSLVPARAVGVS
jgi:hypothetical protein